MALERAAIRYAKALLSLAIDQDSTKAVANDMELYAKTIAESEDLANFLKTPNISRPVITASLLQIFKDSSALTVNLIHVLSENNRLPLLEQVALEYTKLYNAHIGLQLATVTTAVPINEALETKITDKIKALTGKSAELENIIDESILGGFILRVGDIQYNASIANKLSELKREFTLN
ncbi:ATP synthase F1 subunit delta [Oceanihabitans sp. IOP_32]|uniref:ATP synthase F1 subunit delta n=1 Tax=Oceanihabitans sp. IOP_32 TaxID=2529032 RepID=UPI0012930500|nr:ATP synthase F1 subunit delta [Oceanihabitans sp. IOP_32]QFZ54407.1 ATP synthase F1 subunit delta [Oceanihabitans sp. IOP_32]